MIRAVSDDAALMGGPNQGSRSLGSSPANVPISSARAVSNHRSSCAPLRSRNRAAMVSGLTLSGVAASCALNSSGCTADWTVTSSK